MNRNLYWVLKERFAKAIIVLCKFLFFAHNFVCKQQKQSGWQVAPLVQGETNSKGQVQRRTVRLQFFTDPRLVFSIILYFTVLVEERVNLLRDFLHSRENRLSLFRQLPACTLPTYPDATIATTAAPHSASQLQRAPSSPRSSQSQTQQSHPWRATVLCHTTWSNIFLFAFCKNLERPTSPRIVTNKQHSKAYVDAAHCNVNTFIHKHPTSPYRPLCIVQILSEKDVV